ncbi:Nitrilotriacetate monooxygenase component A [Roseomonas mucosa]|uniref:Nitrilotriacetate monooxygenase n=1 Tax=Roseomonas mucosa TaxID=207340 RepID=A0A1S8D649_9PROT|nr:MULTISPECIES: LLM class flavin-dependent oxidoreductase [Roseomonas]MBS5903683.1 LLM class flavin-dependent oxidoreductase [Acetobacteraceae bacterium]ATR22420.1 LLM class flavin-dependent oxidoreductase [Roseomonas sp. FDAARGOS_362]MCG7351686.1 LLM class flavin-dependent oxidoreductase [Roseomonas mucosa]MCG7355285.1 LLM class flavin-dependent oxidoreductase [Roseomonas mucosa]MDT8288489.1 LLM class flavin-dependent oxidoreductase [Roseomonas mucosa]
MPARKMISMGLSMRYLGYHAAAWRHPQVDPGGASDFSHFLNVARLAEAAKFDMVFLADGIGIRAKDEPPGSLCRSAQTAELEPLTLLSALAPMTTHIGLVATASTTYNEPYHIARKYASLDRISGGRAGWNIVTSWSDAEAQNFNRDQHLDYGTRYERAAEFVEVVKGLWDSWDADALVRDKESGIFFDAAKLHVLNHQGKHFKVKGPLSVARSPQARPVLVQAGASEAGMEIGAESAEVIYAVPHEIDTGRSYYRDLKERAARKGRDPEGMKILPGITPFIGETEAEAREKYDLLNALVAPELGLSYLYGQMGDLSAHSLDGPVPEPNDPKVRSIAQNLLKLARRDNLTIRQLYTTIAAGFGSRILIGTAKQIADEMEAWVEAEAADGFNICPAALPVGLEDFAAQVVPELQRRGMFRTEYASRTLRGNLGVPVPASRYGGAVVPAR